MTHAARLMPYGVLIIACGCTGAVRTTAESARDAAVSSSNGSAPADAAAIVDAAQPPGADSAVVPDAQTPPPSALGDAGTQDAATVRDAEAPVADAASAGAPPDADVTVGPGPTTHDAAVQTGDLGQGDGHDVVAIGDSWMSNDLGSQNGIVGALFRLTQQPYRSYAIAGTMVLQDDSFGIAIPSQYERAKAANADIATIVMTGGGNDIIQFSDISYDCLSDGSLCQAQRVKIASRLEALWTEMANDGVKDVVMIRYAAGAGELAESVAPHASLPAICTSGRMRCHVIETTASVNGELLDGLHPTAAANDRIANVVFSYMREHGIRR